jgi:hypothetical protein
MRNVAAAVATSAWLLASADETLSLEVADVVANAGQARVKVEDVEGAKLAGQNQAQIVQAWKKWYSEAVQSVSRLVVGTPSDAFAKRLNTLAAAFTGPSH